MSDIMISCKNLYVSYGRHPVVEDLTFDVREGDCIGILGENGSGKSTLIKAMMGLIKPDAGEIVFRSFSRKDVGYLPQQSESQKDFPALVREMVLSGVLAGKGPVSFAGKADRARADECMERMGISFLAERKYSELSGGQQQRVLLARALCAARRLLVLDEPVTGLDPLVTSELYGVIKEKNTEDGLTVIFVSHTPEDACAISNRIMHLCHCGVRFIGSVDDYRKSEAGEEYLRGNH